MAPRYVSMAYGEWLKLEYCTQVGGTQAATMMVSQAGQLTSQGGGGGITSQVGMMTSQGGMIASQGGMINSPGQPNQLINCTCKYWYLALFTEPL